jgi:hypothetical protein
VGAFVNGSGPDGPPSACEGISPRALAAFIKRPQAACSNRRYRYSIIGHFFAVKGKRLMISVPFVVFLFDFSPRYIAAIIFGLIR